MGWLQDREQFFYLMAKEGMPEPDVRRVLRLAQTIQRLAVEECNRTLGDTEKRRCDKAIEHLDSLCVGLGWEVPKTSGDPRGACVKLRVPSGKTNDWGQEGICVPTRS